MIKLVKSTFFDEKNTKKKLVDFIEKSDMLSMGEETRKFEQNFARMHDRAHALFVNSGSTANLILLQALVNMGKVKPGARVGISAITWATNVMPIIQLNLIPVLIDCELDTLNVSSRTVKKLLPKLDVLFLTNVLGLADDLHVIESMCEKEGVLLLEDNCESLGSKMKGRFLGNFSFASTFSFFVGHHLSTIEGGMVLTDDEDLYHQMVMVRAHGWSRNLNEPKKESLKLEHGVDDFFDLYTFYDLAFNYRPTDINAFVGNVQLPLLEEMNRRREKNFYHINKAIVTNTDIIPLRSEHMDVFSNFAVPLIFKSREAFEKYRDLFHSARVEIRPIIAGNMARQPFYKKYVVKIQECPNADYIHQHGFYFGNNPELTPAELQLISKLLSVPKPSPKHQQIKKRQPVKSSLVSKGR